MPDTMELYPDTIRAGETILTADHPGAIDRPGGMDVWTINYTLHGRGRIGSGDERFLSEVGDLLLWPPGLKHDYGYQSSIGDWTHLWICFFPRKEWLKLLKWPVADAGVMHLHIDDPALRQQTISDFEETIAVLHGPQRRKDEFALNLLEKILLWCDTFNPLSEMSFLDTRIQVALTYLCDNFQQSITLADLADSCSLSESRISHLFHKQVGSTPMQYLEHYRITRAQELLVMTSEPVGEIAFAVGYQDPLYFSRIFRRHAGISPRHFRQAAQMRKHGQTV